METIIIFIVAISNILFYIFGVVSGAYFEATGWQPIFDREKEIYDK